jgi:hypothetical protein
VAHGDTIVYLNSVELFSDTAESLDLFGNYLAQIAQSDKARNKLGK